MWVLRKHNMGRSNRLQQGLARQRSRQEYERPTIQIIIILLIKMISLFGGIVRMPLIIIKLSVLFLTISIEIATFTVIFIDIFVVTTQRKFVMTAFLKLHLVVRISYPFNTGNIFSHTFPIWWYCSN